MSLSFPDITAVSTTGTYQPELDADRLHDDLMRIVLPGPLPEGCLAGRIRRLESRFETYRTIYPYGLWAPGLALEQEMRSATESLLPLDEVRSAIRALCRAVLASPVPDIPLFHSAACWLDILPRLPVPLRMVNPARLLRTLVQEESRRVEFLFALHLPARYGGGFRRYPRQLEFIGRWVSTRQAGADGSLCCLDAACGSGEGTYELGMLLLEAGFGPDAFTLHGVSLDLLEIFAAAHGYFPHDAGRQSAFRTEIAPLFDRGGEKSITFSTGDIVAPRTGTYDLILCNGVLGGPLLHREEDLQFAAKSLAERLKPGGMLLAADRFHAGWEKKVPKERLMRFLRNFGLDAADIEEGIAVTKKAAA